MPCLMLRGPHFASKRHLLIWYGEHPAGTKIDAGAAVRSLSLPSHYIVATCSTRPTGRIVPPRRDGEKSISRRAPYASYASRSVFRSTKNVGVREMQCARHTIHGGACTRAESAGSMSVPTGDLCGTGLWESEKLTAEFEWESRLSHSVRLKKPSEGSVQVAEARTGGRAPSSADLVDSTSPDVARPSEALDGTSVQIGRLCRWAPGTQCYVGAPVYYSILLRPKLNQTLTGICLKRDGSGTPINGSSVTPHPVNLRPAI
ncbi:hypothetical protein DFH09DRAFT_1069506 [Mycena vulgaris]|nr:hypothetical protein DFH09DRAFT_1069506 [Mycena vulgaris]